MKVLFVIIFVINGFFIAGLVATLVWAAFAIGTHEEFQTRFTICTLFQGACLVLMAVRRVLRDGRIL